MQFVWYHWMVEWFGLISINGAHRKPWFSCSFLTLKPFSFWTKTIFFSSGNLPRREKGERRRGKKKKKKRVFLCWGGKAMSWRRVAKSLQALTAHSLLLSFTLLLVLKLHHTISYSWWSVLFLSLCMYVLTRVCISFLFYFIFLWVFMGLYLFGITGDVNIMVFWCCVCGVSDLIQMGGGLKTLLGYWAGEFFDKSRVFIFVPFLFTFYFLWYGLNLVMCWCIFGGLGLDWIGWSHWVPCCESCNKWWVSVS